jgi:hypothetical protein
MLSKPSEHADSRGPADGSLNLPQRKGVRQRNKPPVNQHSKNPAPKQDGYNASFIVLCLSSLVYFIKSHEITFRACPDKEKIFL